MKKSEVLGYFGGVVKTAAALGTSKTTVSMWGEEVPWKWALLIQAVTAGARPDGEKVPAAGITQAYFELGMTFPELYDDSHPEALAR
ncbi:TPA: Cro/CI family transcriptional regulator, partial [Escherichia coli]